MTMPLPDLAPFLRRAKCATYAAQGDEATVPSLVAGAKQLEFLEGEWRYQDLYVGMRRFAGQEIVYRHAEPIWSMTYAGGLEADLAGTDAGAVYAFLRSALLLAPAALPLRGPEEHQAADLHYACQVDGDLASFHGRELIRKGSTTVYTLRFSGGLLG